MRIEPTLFPLQSLGSGEYPSYYPIMNRVVFALLLAFLLGSCAQEEPQIPLDQDIYFTMQQLEAGSTITRTYLLDDEGYLFKLDKGDPFMGWEISDDTLFWASAALQADLALDHELIDSVSLEDLRDWVSRIPPNEGVAINRAIIPCCGLPIVDYVAWVYEPEEDRYRSIMLGTSLGEQTMYREHRTRQGRKLMQDLMDHITI